MAKTSRDASFFVRIKIALELLTLSMFLGTGVGIAKAQLPGIPPPPRVPINQQEPARGHSTVRGRAVFSDTGQPAAAQRLQLISTRFLNSGGPMIFTVADTSERGEFQFGGLAAGDYYLVPADPRESPSYPFPMPTGDSAADSARMDEFAQRATKVSLDGQNSVEVELRIINPHFGALSGYVANSNGEMVAHTLVSCTSTGPDRSRLFGLSAMTDDKGAFRIQKVPPGEYLVSANPPPKNQPGRAAMGVFMPSFIPTFYPSATNSASATPISVAPDSETPNVNITLIDHVAHTVSGIVRMRATGTPVANVSVRLSPLSGAQLVGTAGLGEMQPSTAMDQFDPRAFPQIQRADEDGRWLFNNVPDGSYMITIEPRQTAPARNNANSALSATTASPSIPKFSAQRQRITVDGADLTDVAIELSAGGSISGSVVVEGDRPLPSRLGILAGAKNGTQPPSTAAVQADGTFVLTGVPEGEVSLVPQLRPTSMFYVKAIEANGIDLRRERLRIEDGTEIKSVRVVISSAVAVLTGHVLSAEGKTPLSRMAVFLVPAESDKRDLVGGHFTAMTSAEGVFTIVAAPGDYIVVAIRPGEGDPLNPEALAANKLHITLQANERRTLDILR